MNLNFLSVLRSGVSERKTNMEGKYYKEYKAEASDNIMERNSFNPYYIKSELLNF